MRNNKKTILIIVLAVVAILAIVGGVLAYLFLATDTFKSGQQLFAKYLMQNLAEIEEITSLDKLEQLGKNLETSKHEENLTISSENSEMSSLFEEITLDTQNDPINKKYYGILGLSNSNFEEPLQIEYMIDSDMYSLRFTNAIKEFLTIRNDGLKDFAEKLGADEETINYIPNYIDFEEFSLDKLKITEQEKQTEANKYMNLLYSNISEEKYTKSKDVVITVNGKTITTNAYILTLNMQDVKNLLIKFLETLKQDEIVLNKFQVIDEMIQDYVDESVKDMFIDEIEAAISELNQSEVNDEEKIIITIYEENGKTVRLKAEQGLSYITLDTMEVDGKKQIDFNFTNIDEENVQLSNKVTFIKENSDKLKIKMTNIEGEEQQNLEFNVEIIEKENNVKIDININSDAGTISINRNINLVDEIEYDVELNSSNNVILNDLTQERMVSIFSIVGTKLSEEYLEPIEKIVFMQGFGATDLNEVEISHFNMKFQPYEGPEKTTADVNTLLQTIVLNNTQQRDLNELYVIVSGDITLDEADTIAPVLEGNKNYKVQCKMDEDGRINEIVITETIISLENNY